MKAWMHPYAIEAEPCKAVPGALLYTQYNFLIRFIMKRISEASGGSTDTSRDHIYTDWRGLDGFVTGFIARGAGWRVLPLTSPENVRLRRSKPGRVPSE